MREWPAYVFLLFVLNSPVMAVMPGFVERFQGEGDQLDNPEWKVSIPADLDFGFEDDGGLRVHDTGDYRIRFVMPLLGNGNTHATLDLRDVDIFEASVNIIHWESITDICCGLGVALSTQEVNGEPDYLAWFVRQLGAEWAAQLHEQSSVIRFELLVDDAQKNYVVRIGEPGNPDLAFDSGPIALDRQFDPEGHSVQIGLSGGSPSRSTLVFEHFSLIPTDSIPGDYNGNGSLDTTDIGWLSAEALEGAHRTAFDLTDDGLIDGSDFQRWVELSNAHVGDANLDGEFASSDLVNVFTAGEYEDEVELNSTWATGDWNGDGDFTTGDLVLAFQDGGYEQGPRVATNVPEPAAGLLLVTGAGILSRWQLRYRVFG